MSENFYTYVNANSEIAFWGSLFGFAAFLFALYRGKEDAIKLSKDSFNILMRIIFGRTYESNYKIDLKQPNLVSAHTITCSFQCFILFLIARFFAKIEIQPGDWHYVVSDKIQSIVIVICIIGIIFRFLSLYGIASRVIELSETDE